MTNVDVAWHLASSHRCERGAAALLRLGDSQVILKMSMQMLISYIAEFIR